MTNKLAMIAVISCCVAGCVDETTDDCASASITVRELPDANAELSADVDVYTSSIRHTSINTYTLPNVSEYVSITLTKNSGYCDAVDAFTVADQGGRVIVDISTESTDTPCFGWASVMSVDGGNGFEWILASFGGTAKP